MKNTIISFLLSASLSLGSSFFGSPVLPAQDIGGNGLLSIETGLPMIEGTSLLARETGLPKVKSRMLVTATAYSSTPGQTDDTPFITAAGTETRAGIVAANFLPMGTSIRMPELYGEKVFVVEDRMHPRKGYQVDIWFADTKEALDFGAKIVTIEVLGS